MAVATNPCSFTETATMFTCDSYRRLHEELQAQLLFKDGIFLMTRTTQKFRAELFSLFGFYVEIFFEKTDEPLFVKPFEGIAGLKPYLGQINIDTVLQNIMVIKGERSSPLAERYRLPIGTTASLS